MSKEEQNKEKGAGGGEPSDRERLARIILFGREYKQSPKEMADAILAAGFSLEDFHTYDALRAGGNIERNRIRRAVEELAKVQPWRPHLISKGYEECRKEMLAIIDKEEKDNE